MVACETKFDAEVPFGCIGEIISDVRSGQAKPRVLALKAMWVLGCVVTALDGVVEIPDNVFYTSQEDLADKLHEAFVKPDFVQDTEGGETIETSRGPKAIPPETWAMLIQLLIQLIAGWKKS